MPESATKKRLVSKLNEANGKGTPDVSMSGSVRTVGRRQRRRSGGDGLINLLTSRRKRRPLATGTYTLRQPEGGEQQQGHSFRRQTSLQPEMSTPGLAHVSYFLPVFRIRDPVPFFDPGIRDE
jgi:hypothetical protein